MMASRSGLLLEPRWLFVLAGLSAIIVLAGFAG
jgi:hypothetical protein